MSRPWTCPVCQTVINLGNATPEGKLTCPTCGTEFAYPLRRQSSAGGDDREPDRGGHTPQPRR